jgi:hypothetical protein
MNKHGTPAFYWNFTMPNRDTFSIPPIARFLAKELEGRATVVDPFARNAKVGTITNDLNPKTDADHHMKADDFIQMLIDKGVRADAVLIDPPYSPHQVKECYESIGLDVTTKDTQTSRTMSIINGLASQVLRPGGIAISFGWNSTGLGMKNGMRKLSVHLVPHGSALRDTIIVVEEKGGGP